MSSPASDLYDTVRQAVADTPYQVTPLDDGFTIGVDLPERRWQSLFSERGLRQTFRHEVRIVDERRKKLSVTDELYELSWSGGVAHLGACVAKQSGRIIRKSFGASSDGSWTFDSEEGRRLVTDPAKRLGWTVVFSATQKIGAVAGIFGGAVALLTLVGMLVAFLAKTF